MKWTPEQLGQHKRAAEILEKIKDDAFVLVSESFVAGMPLTEHEVTAWIIAKLNESNLVLDDNPPIVAFGPNAAIPHYNAMEGESLTIDKGNVLLLDIWSRLNEEGAPFADITWMGWTGGEIPSDVQQAFDAVLEARDAGIAYLKANLGKDMKAHEVDDICRAILRKHGLDEKFIHSTGHHLCHENVHGGCYIFKKDDERPVVQCTGATIEPGIYIEGKFGIRMECDLYITKESVEVTTPLQMEWVML